MSSYASKRDWWIMAVLWICLGFMFVGIHAALTEPVAPWMRVFAASFFAVFAALIGWLLRLAYQTFYTLDAEHLSIELGPFKFKIPIAEITEASPSHNPLSSPAWSLDRVRIRHTSSSFGALISPERQLEFIAELDDLAPQLRRQGNRLVLADPR